MKVWVIMDPLYERALGVASSEELGIKEIERLSDLDLADAGEYRRAYHYELLDFEIDAPANHVKVPA